MSETRDLVALLQKNASKALERIEKKLEDPTSNPSLSQLGVLAGIMIDKGQILQNRPTEIVSITERLEVDQVAMLLLKELERRQITIEAVEVE